MNIYEVRKKTSKFLKTFEIRKKKQNKNTLLTIRKSPKNNNYNVIRTVCVVPAQKAIDLLF